ncbi:MAG: oligoendopeptidase F [Treponemataceae bacterium]|nr:oligoendopeptidase F [Treponemataceae bacterium]
MSTHKIPKRSEIPASDKWNLSSLYTSEKDWEMDLELIPDLAKEIASFKGKLAESPDNLRNALDTYCRMGMVSETLGSYAFLLTAGDAEDSANQDKYGRYVMTVTQAEAEISFFEPEIQTIPDETLEQWLERPDFGVYKIYLQKLNRLKAHILSDKEERLLTLGSESGLTAHNTFGMLTNVDLDYGKVRTKDGLVPLTQSTWSSFMESEDREVRKNAYTKFYRTFDKHKNTLASLYAGSVAHDVFEARARGYSSARQMALFPDQVDESVYDNLISTVRANFAPLHKYYSIRKKLLKLDELRHYDVYAPLVADCAKNTSYDQAVEICRNALKPLGSDYTDILCTGLRNGWVDRYENKGKRSGAFSEGVYIGDPYILLNYKEDVIRDVFTMAHEGGHSMHSWYAVRSNPFMHYNYTIFEAEVASTFNEQLVFEYLLKNSDSENMRRYLIATRASDILATLYRQTMFAEFEHKAHVLVEQGMPLSADVLRKEYRALLEAYFGPEMHFEKTSDLEGLRIPHFYNAYYVYKYATGISASLALAKRVVTGGEKEKQDYFKFLQSGGSRYPIDALKVAGVDMSSAKPVQDACDTFAALVDQMESWL